ncbi:MAG: Rpn family recombination-promoting nuclease/putative transposase [Spirochaetaceae bacterium]|nr:MAG: Rpn family recombination-promoting nuclease/putative transposase [Spirochaetaceae bacterium]
MDKVRPLNPMADIFVRYLLGSEENTDILIDFINAVFSQKGHDLVVEIQLLNPFNLRTIRESKESILDVKAKDSKNRWINIEIQIAPDASYANRSLYYWAKSYAGQLKTGDAYGNLNPAVCINLMDFEIFPQLPGYHSCFQITEVDAPEYVLSEHLQIHFIELPKNQLDGIRSVKNQLDAWCYYFENEGSKEDNDMTVLLKDNPAIQKAHKIYHNFTANDELMDMAEAREKWQRDVDTRLKSAKKEGKKEAARKMIDEGFEIEVIARITGLSEEEIRDL